MVALPMIYSNVRVLAAVRQDDSRALAGAKDPMPEPEIQVTRRAAVDKCVVTPHKPPGDCA
jgi:hypothetical protein